VTISNNPPAVVLELTEKQAKFLLSNCNSNIEMALRMLTQHGNNRAMSERVIALNEQFKELRAMLLKQGIEP